MFGCFVHNIVKNDVMTFYNSSNLYLQDMKLCLAQFRWTSERNRQNFLEQNLALE